MVTNKNYKKIFAFAIIIAIALVIISFLLSTNINFAKPVVYAINAFGFETKDNIYFGEFGTIEINNFCSGFYSIVVFLAITLSPITQVNKRRRIYLVIFGSLFLYLLNFSRTIVIVALSNHTTQINLLHEAGWFVMSIAIFLIWYIWGWEKERKKELINSLPNTVVHLN